MKIQRNKFTVITFFLCGLIFFIAVGMQVLANKNTTQLADEPIYALNVFIDDVEQRDRLFDQLRRFSDKHAFAIRIAPTTPEDKNLISHMWREDIKLVMVNPFEEEKYRIYFYKNSANAVPEDILNLLVLELKSFLTDTPSVIVTERK
ncbi:hypothetical protein [Thalassolituus oleivorans]|nr:hypothetical protein [Thalassolituus oleivorans]